jgi:hypothetical protein
MSNQSKDIPRIYMTLESWQAAKTAEARCDWHKAAEIWDANGERLLGDACRLIIQANERGDRFREIVRGKLKAAGLPHDIGVCAAYTKILEESQKQLVEEVTA